MPSPWPCSSLCYFGNQHDCVRKSQERILGRMSINPATGMPEHIFEWGGAGDELQVHMKGCNNGVRGGAPEKFCNPRPIIHRETPCLNIDMHPVLVENGR